MAALDTTLALFPASMCSTGADRGDDLFHADEAQPGGLWDPNKGEVAGGVNQADVEPPPAATNGVD